MKMIMIRKFLFYMGLLLIVTTFSSCSDDDSSGGASTEGYHFNYSVSMQNGMTSQVVIIDSITGNVSAVASSESWLKAQQDGLDGEGHPVLLLTIADNSNMTRTARVTFVTADARKVCLTVVHKGDVGSNSDKDDLPEVTSMNKAFYENWFEGDNKQVYITESSNKQTWKYYTLPWFDNALGSVPTYVAEEMEKKKDDWRLVYSTLGLPNTPGANFFVLHNNTLGKLRFFYFIPAGYIGTASSACFMLEMYNSSGKISMALNGNEPIEMPNELQNNDKVKLNPTAQSFQLIPIGTGGSRSVTTGWACFDLLVDHAYTDVSKEALEDPKTTFTLRLVTALEGDIRLLSELGTSGDMDMSGISLSKKGNSLAAAATFFNGFGASLNLIGSGICNAEKSPGGYVQIAGGISTMVGTFLNTAVASKDSKQSFNGSAKIDLKTSGTTKGKITVTTINDIAPIRFRPISFNYDWKTLLTDNPQKRPEREGCPHYGLANLIKTPVIYVSSDHLLYSPAQNPATYEMDYGGQAIHCITNDDEELRYISFLDPSTVGVYLNKENMGFDFDNVSVSVSPVADIDPKEIFTAFSPYYDFLKLKNEGILISSQEDVFIGMFSESDTKSMKLVECKNTDIPTIVKDKDLNASYKVTELPCSDDSVDIQEKNFKYRYYGLTASLLNANRSVVVDPIIYVPTNKDHFYFNKSKLGPMMVELCVTLHKGEKSQIITKHFLPEIRTFKQSEIGTIRERINQTSPTTVQTNSGEVPADFVDIGWQKKKALKMLELSDK